MADHANSTTAPAFQVLEVCRQCAAEIRNAAKTAGPGALDDADRASLLVLADLIEIRAGYKVDLRPALECALDGAIGLLNAADGDVDLEDDNPAEPGGDEEETLGWSAAMSQLKLGANTADGDKTAPERHGKGFVRCGRDDYEPEAGYDLPEGDDEWDGEGEDKEPLLGAPENHDCAADQRHWAQGGHWGCVEPEIGEEESHADAGRLLLKDIDANRLVARDMRRRAEAIRRRKRTCGTEPRDPDEIEPDNLRPIGSGLMSWGGPARG